MAHRDNPEFLSASTIKGDKVVNTAGEDLGKIEELMIDVDDGRIAYAALSFGGFLGMGNKLFAIPWQALKLRLHEHTFLLDIPKETLERAEGFDTHALQYLRDNRFEGEGEDRKAKLQIWGYTAPIVAAGTEDFKALAKFTRLYSESTFGIYAAEPVSKEICRCSNRCSKLLIKR